MSRSPRMYVRASFYHGILTEDETDEFNNELDALGLQIALRDDDSGIQGHFANNYVTVFAFLTKGWGDAITAEEFAALCNDFVTIS